MDITHHGKQAYTSPKGQTTHKEQKKMEPGKAKNMGLQVYNFWDVRRGPNKIKSQLAIKLIQLSFLLFNLHI